MFWSYKLTLLDFDENGKLVEAKNQHHVKRFFRDCLNNFILYPMEDFVINHPIWTDIIGMLIGTWIGSHIGVWLAFHL
jgi:hypothetical protein|nr:MAG TPA_asm: hypothetical protein [Caudoviricetes sp.]